VYTSGTTGKPKGVMLTHDNVTWNMIAQSEVLKKGFEFSEEERIVSFLPLSHIAGYTFDSIVHLLFGHCIYFARPDALQGTIVQTL